MASTKLIIRDYKGNRNLDNSSLVFCLYTYGYKKTLLSSGIKVPISAFDSQKQQVRKSYPGHIKTNLILQAFKRRVDDVVQNLILAGETPDVSKVKQLVRSKKKKTKAVAGPNLFEFFEQFIISQEHLKRQNTLKSYRATLRIMKEYSTHIGNSFDFDDIDLEWYEDLVKYLYSYRNNGQNTVGSHIKVLKVIMNASAEQGLHSNPAYKNPKFKTLSNASDGIYCSLEELNLIASHDFSNPTLDNARSIFLLTAFLGTRWSDTCKLQAGSIQNGCIVIHVTKTGDKLTLPIHPIVQGIIDKYMVRTGKPFPRFYKSEQPYNRALKLMARQIGGPFSKPVLKKVNRGNRQITETKPKSEYMCSHVGRRSFCTNLAKNNIPIATIQRLSGHKTLKSLQIYLRQSNEEAASMVQQFWNNQATIPPSSPSKSLVTEPVSLN